MARKTTSAGNADSNNGNQEPIDSGTGSPTPDSKPSDTTTPGTSGNALEIDTPVVKKGRGRPALTEEERAARAASTDSITIAGPRSRRIKSKLDVSGSLAPTIQFVHAAAANFTSLPFLELQKDEAIELSKAAADVFAQYDLQVSPMVAAWLQLFTVATAIYAPRAMAFKAVKDFQRNEAKKQPTQEQTVQ